MKNFTDQEILQSVLNDHKLSATCLTTLVLESSNQNLRNDATWVLDRTFQHQKKIFDIMSQKGWYKTQPATQQEISAAQQEVSKIQSSAFTM